MQPVNEMNLEFPSRSVNEGFARTAVACFAAQLDPTIDELNDIKTAVSEAVTNSIVHAYPGKIGPIHIRARIFEDRSIEIVVKDKGIGIPDIEQAKKPLFTTGNEERSGMGFTIMDSFTDKLVVRSRPGYGTTVKMLKKMLPFAGLK